MSQDGDREPIVADLHHWRVLKLQRGLENLAEDLRMVACEVEESRDVVDEYGRPAFSSFLNSIREQLLDLESDAECIQTVTETDFVNWNDARKYGKVSISIDGVTGKMSIS
jgi:hypothetical protein